ncbi:MAG: tRNA (adenosine(37)-N6)-dimethylallyltransferase MiaA [Pseudomonadota bacterium]
MLASGDEGGAGDAPRARDVVLIAGPTASGKSALALRLADALDGVVVNADAMQVYAGLRVLTARPSAEDEARAPHRLYGTVDPARAYSVADWLADIAPVLQAPGIKVVVGGTGLYFSALTEGLSEMPPVPDEIRAHWRARAVEEGPEALHAVLAARDPQMAARLRPSDPQRLSRALEVLDATGRSLRDWQARRSRPLVVRQARRFVLAPDRAWLHRRIEARLDDMVGEGAIDEALALTARGLPADRPALKALGVSALTAAARGEMALSDAVSLTARDTRRFAKRQETWFRNQFADWPRAAPDDESVDVIAERILNA